VSDQPPANPAPPPGRPWRALLALAVVILIAGGGVLYYVSTLHTVTTDDATVQADIVGVMPKVPAYVQTLHVTDNSTVTAGQILLELDPRDYALQVAAAGTALQTAQSRVAEAQAQVDSANATIAQDTADMDAADATSRLQTEIADRRMKLTNLSESVEARETAETNATTAQAALSSARLKITTAQTQLKAALAQVQTTQAGVAQAEVALNQARLNLSYTTITSPIDGTIANRNVVVGDYVEPGQLLLSVVPHTLYITANFKETQLESIKPGQKAEIRVDALGGRRLTAHVDSIQRGSGSVFALLPPENATGNFVKVVQRLPVKLFFDSPDISQLAPGMSVEVTVDTN
jgi:membrane fusion protein, multidrug efflux system